MSSQDTASSEEEWVGSVGLLVFFSGDLFFFCAEGLVRDYFTYVFLGFLCKSKQMWIPSMTYGI